MHGIIKPDGNIHFDLRHPLLHAPEARAHEAVVPTIVLGGEEHAPDLVRQQQLRLLSQPGGGEAGRHVGGEVFVLDTPFVALRGERPGGQADGARGEGDGHGDGFLVPGRVGGHEAGVVGDVAGGHVRGFVTRDGVNDAQGFEFGERRMGWQLVRKLDVAGVAHLGHHDDGLDFLDDVVVRRGGAVKVAGHLDTEIRDGDEALEDVLGHDVGVVAFFDDVIGGDVDVVGAGSEIGCGDGAGPPFGLRCKGLLLELGGCRDDDVFAVDILGFGCHGRQLLLLLLLLLDFGGLLALHAGRADLHTKNDVTDFTTCERRCIDIVLLPIVVEDQVTQLHLNLDPVLV